MNNPHQLKLQKKKEIKISNKKKKKKDHLYNGEIKVQKRYKRKSIKKLKLTRKENKEINMQWVHLIQKTIETKLKKISIVLREIQILNHSQEARKTIKARTFLFINSYTNSLSK